MEFAGTVRYLKETNEKIKALVTAREEHLEKLAYNITSLHDDYEEVFIF